MTVAKRMLPRLLAAAALGIGAVAATWNVPAEAITYGQLDSRNLYANVGTICGTDKGSGQRFNFCTGTLIHPRIYLTAGHVSWSVQDLISRRPNRDGHNYYIEDHAVSFSPSNVLDPRSWNHCAAVVTHPSYVAGQRGAPDLGVLVLQEPVTNIRPALLPRQGFLDALRRQGALNPQRTYFGIAGYGGFRSPNPRYAEGDGRRRYAQSLFYSMNADWLVLRANPAARSGGTWAGDSGGPTFWTAPDGTQTLVAVTSQGRGAICEQVRLDTSKAISFIQGIVRRVEEGEL
jgi:hypothetical protein